MLAEGKLAAGVQLDLELARDVVTELGRKIDLSLERTATGILTVAAASMANAIKTITIERGIDPRGGTLIAYGGAGPLMSTLLAGELDIASIVVPQFAGAFSAWGLLTQDITREVSRTRITGLDSAGLEVANTVLAELFAGLRKDEDSRTTRECALDCRYLGQEYTLTVTVPSKNGKISGDASGIRSLFVAEYQRAFGYELLDDVQIVSMRATLRRSLHDNVAPKWSGCEMGVQSTKRVDAWSFSQGGIDQFLVLDRESLQPAAIVAGPAIVREATATTYVDRTFTLRVGADGELHVNREA